jgi:hypothetical protein
MLDQHIDLARLKRSLKPAVGGALAIGALIAVFTSSGGIDDVRGALDKVTVGWTVAALTAMAVGYLLLALHLRRLARPQISVRQAIRTDLLLFGVGNVLPGAPAPGAVLASAHLRRADMSTRAARFVIALTAWFNIRTLLGIGALAFLIAFARQHPGMRETGPWWVAAVGVLVLLAATARMAASGHRRTDHPRARRPAINRVAPPLGQNAGATRGWHAEAKAIVGSLANRAVLVALAAGSWLADAACL